MNKEEIGLKLASVMDIVSVCEGLIYATTSGEVIIGQTLTEMDHEGIAKGIAKMFEANLEATQKGTALDITVGLNDGYLIAVKKDAEMVIGLLGSDGKSSVGLLSRQLKNIME